MYLWLISIALLSAVFSSASFAFWEEFNIISKEDGSVSLQAKYRFNEHIVTLRSTTLADQERYIALLKQQKNVYVPVKRAAEFFENNNIKRQKEGKLFHLYAVSWENDEWGFLHLGRKQTFGVLSGLICYYAQKDKVLNLWENLQIIQKRPQPSSDQCEGFERIDKRGLAHLLPVLEPILHDSQKQMCLELGFQLVCKLTKHGYRLSPEKKNGENTEEETVPYQVIAEVYGNDPLCKSFVDAGFQRRDHPYVNTGNGYMDQIFFRAVKVSARK